jgi:hypothetical protein
MSFNGAGLAEQNNTRMDRSKLRLKAIRAAIVSKGAIEWALAFSTSDRSSQELSLEGRNDRARKHLPKLL